jgi:hypothetical protein
MIGRNAGCTLSVATTAPTTSGEGLCSIASATAFACSSLSPFVSPSSSAVSASADPKRAAGCPSACAMIVSGRLNGAR